LVDLSCNSNHRFGNDELMNDTMLSQLFLHDKCALNTIDINLHLCINPFNENDMDNITDFIKKLKTMSQICINKKRYFPLGITLELLVEDNVIEYDYAVLK